MKTEMKKLKTEKEAELAKTLCSDKDCPIHGKLKTRGRVFGGKVIRKFHRRVTIEFERMVYMRKYERYLKNNTKIHARLPDCMEYKTNIGDTIQIRECRPLSKMIHFVVIKKTKDRDREKK